MAFVHPWWLLVLPVWALLVFWAKAREVRREHAAPDFLLWRHAAARLPQASARARPVWRDLAWVAPLVLLTLGLAAPGLRQPAAAVPVVVLVDRSASMSARGDARATRLLRGLVEARRLLGDRPLRLEGLPAAPVSDEASNAAVDPREIVHAAIALHAAGTPVLVVTDTPLPDLPGEAGLVLVADGVRNAGIVAAGFDLEAGLIVRIEGDPGCGSRALRIADGEGRELASRPIADASVSTRLWFPAALVAGATRPITVRIDPDDALPADDAVTLAERPAPVRIAIADRAPPSLDRALRACAGVEVVRGGGPGTASILVAPLSGEAGFETGPAGAHDGAPAGLGAFAGLTGPSRWPELHPLAKQPPGVETLLDAGGRPVLVRLDRTYVLLADPDRNGWSAVPSFPLAIARVVEALGAAAAGTLEADRASAVLASAETHAASESPAVARAPAPRHASAPLEPLAPWLFFGAAILMTGLAVSALRRSR